MEAATELVFTEGPAYHADGSVFFTDIANNTSCTPIAVGKNRFLIGASDGRGAENSGAGAQFNGVIEITKSDDEFDQMRFRLPLMPAAIAFLFGFFFIGWFVDQSDGKNDSGRSRLEMEFESGED